MGRCNEHRGEVNTKTHTTSPLPGLSLENTEGNTYIPFIGLTHSGYDGI